MAASLATAIVGTLGPLDELNDAFGASAKSGDRLEDRFSSIANTLYTLSQVFAVVVGVTVALVNTVLAFQKELDIVNITIAAIASIDMTHPVESAKKAWTLMKEEYAKWKNDTLGDIDEMSQRVMDFRWRVKAEKINPHQQPVSPCQMRRTFKSKESLHTLKRS